MDSGFEIVIHGRVRQFHETTGTLQLIIIGPDVENQVVEPDGDLDGIGVCHLGRCKVELGQAVLDVLGGVVVPARLGVIAVYFIVDVVGTDAGPVAGLTSVPQRCKSLFIHSRAHGLPSTENSPSPGVATGRPGIRPAPPQGNSRVYPKGLCRRWKPVSMGATESTICDLVHVRPAWVSALEGHAWPYITIGRPGAQAPPACCNLSCSSSY